MSVYYGVMLTKNCEPKLFFLKEREGRPSVKWDGFPFYNDQSHIRMAMAASSGPIALA